jgi:hypothetical protein
MFSAKRLLLLLPLIGLLSSCSEDFEVSAPYKQVTVIYGLLDAGDTAHYIRIQKAFLDEHLSALEMAKNPDSNFYSSINVHLKEFTDTGINGKLLFDEELARVDLNNEGFPKQAGLFFDKPNYAYKTKRILTPGMAYRLVVTNTSTGQVDSAETSIIDNKPGPTPRGFSALEFNSFFVLSFPVIIESSKFTLQVQVPQYAQIFEGIIRFHYQEKDGSGTTTRDSVDWSFATASRDTKDPSRIVTSLVTQQRDVYYFLRDAIGPAPAGTQRFLDSADVFVWAGSLDMANYQKINGTQGGITADQIKPLYTNIKTNGEKSLGLFTSRSHIVRRNVGIDQTTMDSLVKSSITSPLNIRGRTTD